MTSLVRTALALSLACSVLLGSPALAQEGPSPLPTIEPGLRIGFNGAYKLGKWTELEATLVGGASPTTGQVVVETPDGSGAPYSVTAPRVVQLLPQQKQVVVVPICIGGVEAPIHITYKFKTADGAEASVSSELRLDTPPIANALPIVLQVGPSIGLADLVAKQHWKERSKPEIVQLDEAAKLPQRWFGYDGVDLLVLSSASPELYEKLSDGQRAALFEWLRRGGRVLTGAGASAPLLVAPGRPLAALAPGRFERSYQLTSSRAIEDYSDSTQRLFPTPDTRLDASMFAEAKGRAVVSERGSVPLVTRRSFNFGEVIFVAVDLHDRLLLNWVDLNLFYNRLLGWRPLAEAETAEEKSNEAYMQQHVSDLGTDLRIALEKFSVWPPPFMLVVGMIFAYILLIGPGDYFLLKRLGRMELTWVTFPAIVVLLSIAAYATARTSRGDKLKVRQVNLIDVDVAAQNLRGTTISNIFAPYSASYDLALQPTLPQNASAATQKPDVLLTWYGVPEERAFGGMGNRNSRPILGSTPYALDPDAGTADGAPILTASTKAFFARWSQPADLFHATLTIHGDAHAGDVSGELSLESRLTEKLTSCVLFFGGDSFSLDPIAPNSRWKSSLSSLTRQSLKDRLTDMRQVVDPGRNTYVYARRPYVVASGSEEQVVKATMFYDAIDGADYTGLSNQYLNFVDLSHQLEDGRAMIVAVGETPAAGLANHGAPLSESADVHDYTVYRILVDVKRE